jgi:hypothetical protein
MGSQLVTNSPASHDQISRLWQQEASQPAHALDFVYLIGDALLSQRRPVSITATDLLHIAGGIGGVEFLA